MTSGPQRLHFTSGPLMVIVTTRGPCEAAHAFAAGIVRTHAPDRATAVFLRTDKTLNLPSEGEPLNVQMPARHASTSQLALQHLDHRGRAAEVDLAVGHVRDE